MPDHQNKRSTNNEPAKSGKQDENSRKRLNDPNNPYNWDKLNRSQRPSEYDLANLDNEEIR